MRTLLVTTHDKTFKITVPYESKVTFGPWSPPPKKNSTYGGEYKSEGTLRVYEGQNCIGCFSGVSSFRDVSLSYSEQVAKEEGAVIWKSDQNGYHREENVQQKREWVTPQLPAHQPKKRKTR